MPRNYAQIMCAIWDNPEFLALSEHAQRAYLLLTTQPDISAAGVLRIWTPRWASLSRTSTDEGLKAALSELKQARFIVPDWMTGELLVRSFVRWDGGYKNGKRKPLIEREARAVVSIAIKAQLKVEFEKLNTELERNKLDTRGLPDPTPPPGPGATADRASDALSGSSGMGGDATSELPSSSAAPAAHASSRGSRGTEVRADRESVFPQVDRASDAASGTTSPSRGVVGTSVVSTGDPQPRIPQPVPPSAGAVAPGVQLAVIQGGAFDAASPTETNAGPVMAAWVEAFTATGRQPTKDQRGKAAKDIKQLLDAGNPPAVVLALASAAGAKCRATVSNEMTPGATTAPGFGVQPQQGTASQRANAFLALRKGETA